jgi:two-component system, sensor histidine kinase and response regulator
MLLKGKRILIVEDNAGNLAVATLYLERYGGIVKAVRWGLDALTVLKRSQPIDVILMDLMLPGNLTGFDVFQQIRQIPELQHIPVVAVSASDPDVAMPRAARMGFSGYLSKPIAPNIAQHVASVIEGKKVWAGDMNVYF